MRHCTPRSNDTLRRALRLVTLGLAACTKLTGPEDIVGATPFDPPETYRALWAEVEACASRTGDFDRVRWFVVEGEGTFEHRGRTVVAYWWPSHEVVIAGRFANREHFVRHEMLHDILDSGDHPREFFDTRCGAIVN